MALVRDTLGHSSVSTTNGYLHVRPNDSSAPYLAVSRGGDVTVTVAIVMAFTRGQDNAGWQAFDPSLREIRVNRGHENKRRA